ncbi:cupin domain-containing protein [Streptomyces nitrosporeus]|uniref:Cupin domain-containing protein n=1 Tax=Streptomyces nitrosporeus TaxID=28894 RepID=A0A5J6FHF6_9ACTN|nr:cupin domain-containing protein [Streptomyces nitrosporeus]QEU75643.1 cupin domain-containing protein [Streptomyces nitrosporeus]GGY86835.1 cupin [Streptomyces nitrosporeus]
MSYPEPRYTDGEGEISATYRPAGTPPDLLPRGGGSTHYLATSETTHGEFGLYRINMGPRAGGPATHFHRTISESFFILDGTVRIYDGERWTDAAEDDFVYVPQGGLHAFRNDSDAPASMLLLFTPGAPREEYFEKVAKVSDWPEKQRAEFFFRHDTYWTG